MKNGFTLIELVVVIAVITVLSGIILFTVAQYINRGKDSNISGNLAVLIPAGEVYYNSNGSSGYLGFCGSTVVSNAILQMPANTNSCATGNSAPPNNAAGICCYVKSTNDAWVAYAKEFTNSSNIYCVDSRGVKKDTPGSSSNITTIVSAFQCP